MPAVANDAAAFDPVDFYTKQLPLQLAQLTELRDELRKRQGALTAAEEALKDRDDAARLLADAKANATQIMDDAKAMQAKLEELGVDGRWFSKHTKVSAASVRLTVTDR